MRNMYKAYTKEKIESFEKELQEFFKRKGIQLTPKTDLVKVARDLGFKMYSLSLPQGIDGIISIDKKDKRIGVSNSLKHIDSRRVIAHELGHYIRQINENNGDEETLFFAMKDSIFHDEKKSVVEDEMDYLAAAILVPMEDFIKSLKDFGIENVTELEETNKISLLDKTRLAEHYDVETALIERRIVEACKYGR